MADGRRARSVVRQTAAMADAAAASGTPALPPHPRWLLPLIGASIVGLVVANNVGNAVWASWINEQPLGLLALNSSNKYLIGTTPNTEWLPVLVVSTARLMAPDPLFYMVGHLWSDRAVHWARRVFPASGQLFDAFEPGPADDSVPQVPGQRPAGFTRLLDALAFIAPNNPVCLIAGVAGMPVRRFVVLSLTGTIGRILLMRGIGTVFSDQIEGLLEVVARYQRGLLIASVVGVIAYVLWQLRSHRGLVGGVEDLEEELGD